MLFPAGYSVSLHILIDPNGKGLFTQKMIRRGLESLDLNLLIFVYLMQIFGQKKQEVIF